jgi:hypothetical protein
MKKYAALTLFILIHTIIHAQNNGAYLIPRQIYVGDQAILVVPLPGTTRNVHDIVLTAESHDLPSDISIDFHRIILEQRISGSRLLIEFTAFVPGLLELPIISIGGRDFTGLTVTVNSIIDSRSSLILSQSASSLAMPGTALMLYGTMAVIVLLLLFAVWFILKGRIFFIKWKEKWKRWRLVFAMKLTEKRLQKSLLKGENKRIILDNLSDEFRIFLSFMTGNNCCAMTAAEFRGLSCEFFNYHEINRLFLYDFFCSCDELRFSGVNIDSENILRLLADLRGFLGTFQNTKVEKQKEELA